jgi:HAD superfamily hydrolase (TIGR01490 family)
MKLAIFDFDGTLFLEDTLPFLLKQWAKFGYSKFKLGIVYASLARLYVMHKLGAHSDKSIRAVMRKFLRIFAGMQRAEIEEFFNRCADVIMTRLNSSVVEEVTAAKLAGFHTVLLSGCFEYLLNKVAAVLNIDTVIGTSIFYKDGRVDYRRPLEVVYAADKVLRLQAVFHGKKVEWDESIAYADSSSDIHLLSIVGCPVAVKPDKALKDKAQESGWRILD